MFSKEYFRYLIKNNRFLLILIMLITLLLVFNDGSKHTTFMIQCVISFGLTYLMPVMSLYHVHDKRAVDTYFSLPVSRKAMLVTTVIYDILCAYVPLLISATAYFLSGKMVNVSLLLLLLATLVAVSAMVVFNSTLYLIGNNLVDGIIMIGAYSFMPLALFMVLCSFANSFVAGMNNMDFVPIIYLSPIYLSFNMIIELIESGILLTDMFIELFAIVVIFGYLLYRSYVYRKAERASSTSDKFYSYPLVINVYAFLSLLMISSGFDYFYPNLFEFMKEYFILYVLLFAIYAVAHFIYKRKLSVSIRQPIFYVIAMIIALLFVGLWRNSKGFNLAYRYHQIQNDDTVSINNWYDDQNSDLISYIKKETGSERVSYVSVNVEALTGGRIKMEMSDQSKKIFEDIRISAVDYFYQDNSKDDSNTIMNINDNDKGLYIYHFASSLTSDQLIKLAKDPAVSVMIDFDDGRYVVTSKGKMIPLYIQEPVTVN